MSKKFYYGDDFPIGSIAYYITRSKWNDIIEFGIVEENRTSEIWLEKLDAKRTGATLDGVPIDEDTFPTPWHKLPKGWSYDTRLYEYYAGKVDADGFKKINIIKPETILDAYKNGVLVKLSSIRQGYPEDEIDRNKGWRVRWNSSTYETPWVALPPNNLYKTYAEAQTVVDAEMAEFERQKNLTDAEWSKEQIEHNIQHWIRSYSISETVANEARKFLFELTNIEDVETRVFNGKMQYKRFKNKRWSNV